MSQRPEDYLQFPQNNIQYTKPDLGELADPVDEWVTEQSLYTNDGPAAGFRQEPILEPYPQANEHLLDPQPSHQDYNDVYIGAMKPSAVDHAGHEYLEPMPSFGQEGQQQDNSTKFPSMNLPQLHIEPATARPDLNLDISTPIDSAYGTPAMSPQGTPQPDTLANAFSPLPSPMASPSIGPYTSEGYDHASLGDSHLGDSHLGGGNFMAVPNYGVQLNRSRSVNLEADHANLRPHSRQRSLSHTQLMSLEGRMNHPSRFNNQLSPAHTPQGPSSPRSPRQHVPPVPPVPQQYTQQRSPSSRPLSPNMTPATQGTPQGTPQFQGQDLLAPKPDRKMRAMSDSWRNYEREAIIQSLDQNNMRQNDKMNFSQIEAEVPDSLNTDPEPINIMNFPQYGPRAYSSGATFGSDLQPPVTRHRSLSSPREPITDLKSAPFFNCSICTKTFTRAYNLRSHMRTHTDERPFACQHCGKAFARQHDKKRHEALHSGEKKFACGSSAIDIHWGCGKRFARADALARHFRTEAGKLCLRPLIAEVLRNGQNPHTAPEGIIFKGLKFGDHVLELSNDEVYRVARGGLNEREEQTRRTAIYSAICDQLKGI